MYAAAGLDQGPPVPRSFQDGSQVRERRLILRVCPPMRVPGPACVCVRTCLVFFMANVAPKYSVCRGYALVGARGVREARVSAPNHVEPKFCVCVFYCFCRHHTSELLKALLGVSRSTKVPLHFSR